MPYEVDCDTCDFASTVAEEWEASNTAKEHEHDHPEHFVLIHALEQE